MNHVLTETKLLFLNIIPTENQVHQYSAAFSTTKHCVTHFVCLFTIVLIERRKCIRKIDMFLILNNVKKLLYRKI